MPHRPSVQVTANRNDLPLLTQAANCLDWFHTARDTQHSTGVPTTELIDPNLLTTQLHNHAQASATLNCGITLTNVVQACVQYIHGDTTVLNICTHLAEPIWFTSLDSFGSADRFGISLDAILHMLSILARSKDSVMEVYPLDPADAIKVEEVLIKILHKRFTNQVPRLYEASISELDDPCRDPRLTNRSG